MRTILFFLSIFCSFLLPAQVTSFLPGQEWPDQNGKHINAHGGNVLKVGDTYYWYGENRPYRGFTTEVGVEVYTSKDLLNWTDAGVALSVSKEHGSPIERGCIMERPKVVFCPKTGKYVMLFHLELKGRGYEAAQVGFAVSDAPEGPFTFLRALRPNAGKWPSDFSKKDIKAAKSLKLSDYPEWWTPQWRGAIAQGLFLARDYEGGQMSRDMTVFIDDDGTAYHITSSEDNLTLHLNELTSDFLDFTGRYIRIAPGGQNEAPAIFKHDGTYWLITSGCTGWDPNEARMFSASSLWGPWTQHPTPFKGPRARKTFGGQGTFILQVEGRDIFMADVWNPRHLSESRHIWLPISFDESGKPVIEWKEEWSPVVPCKGFTTDRTR